MTGVFRLCIALQTEVVDLFLTLDETDGALMGLDQFGGNLENETGKIFQVKGGGKSRADLDKTCLLRKGFGGGNALVPGSVLTLAKSRPAEMEKKLGEVSLRENFFRRLARFVEKGHHGKLDRSFGKGSYRKQEPSPRFDAQHPSNLDMDFFGQLASGATGGALLLKSSNDNFHFGVGFGTCANNGVSLRYRAVSQQNTQTAVYTALKFVCETAKKFLAGKNFLKMC